MSEKIFKEKYKNLNNKQKEAVDSIDGPVMVVAGPGTGKTTILTLRIANILKKTDVRPENILALTFTNSGVTAMRKNLGNYINDRAYSVNISTFHSFAENIINEFPHYFEDFSGFSAASELDKVHILEEILNENSFKKLVSFHDLYTHLNNIKQAINDIKKEGLSSKDFADKINPWKKELLSDDSIRYKRDYKRGDKQYRKGDIKPSEELKIKNYIEKAFEISVVLEKYQEKMHKRKLYDFNDMILLVLEQLENNQELKFDLQEKYQYILVDEHQDTNNGQNKIIQFLTDAEHLEGKPNLFTVGDNKQSIYRFQGASQNSFNHFQKIFKEVKVINLKNNYRSNQNILNSSHQLILNSIPESQDLLAFKKEKNKIKFAEFSDYKSEILYIAEDIKKKMDSGLDLKEIAIIYRKNKDVADIQNILNYKNIPYTIQSKENILEDFDIKNIIYYLKSIYNPNSDHDLANLLLSNFLNLNSYDVFNLTNSLKKIKRENNVNNLFEIINNIKLLKSLNIKNYKKIFELSEKILELRKDLGENNLPTFLKIFLEKSSYLEYVLKSKNSRDKLLKIDKIFDEVKRQDSQKTNFELKNFLNLIDSYIKYKISIDSRNPEFLDGVQLITAHQAKGLEYDSVYIPNLCNKRWGKPRGSFSNIKIPVDKHKGDIDDERRLFYVAMTRAKNNLFLSFSNIDWRGEENNKSEFLLEMDDSEFEKINISEFEKNNYENYIEFLKYHKTDYTIWDKKFLFNLFHEKGLSVTSLNNYINCPIKYLFKNLLMLPSEYGASLLFGNIIHKSLEKFFKLSKRENKILKKKYLLNIFENILSENYLNKIDEDRFKKRGNNILSEYYNEYSTKWIVNSDSEISHTRTFKLDNMEEIKLKGKIDKIEYLEKNNLINIIDYKTGKVYSEKNKKTDRLDLERQIIFYHILLKDYKNNIYKINHAYLDFLEKNKNEEFEKHTIYVNDDLKKEIFLEINKMFSEIKTGKFLGNGCSKKDCEYCKLFNNLNVKFD